MGEVWLGRHRASGLPVAIKTIRAKRLRTASYRAAFAREVRAVAGLSHPGIVHIFDHGEVSPEAAEQSQGKLAAGSSYLVMELATAGNLSVCPPEDWPGLRAALTSILQALAHAHSRGLVHRDLKPANVILCGPGDLGQGLKLADFGAVHLLDLEDRRQDAGSVVGTPQYMAPEQILAEEHAIGPATDLYSLGCLAWWLCAGELPFKEPSTHGVMRAHLRQQPPALRPILPLGPGFEGWLRRLLEKDPADRFLSAAQALAALVALDDPVVDTARAEPPPSRPAESTVWPSDDLGTQPMTRTLEGLVPAMPREPLCPRPVLPVPASWRTPTPLPPAPLLDAGLGLFGLRQVPLHGRGPLQDQLWEALRKVGRSGQGQTVLLRGTAGQGKSRLARWLMERAS
ncbi:MAG: serine/threonine-protein kinase PknK, partial [Deltaproteobacteria bacterium]|nr:serine/threonine-protein kinase PknK [Deltaproteobacteria bacterium]